MSPSDGDTYYDSTEYDWVPWIGQAIDAYLAKYNDSEHNAWLSGAALSTFVASLPSNYTKSIAAHSMGNIVVGSAFRSGMSANNYALLHAAVPAACYDSDEGRIRQTTSYTQTAGPLTFIMWANSSPDGDTDTFTRNLAYRGTLQDIGTNTALSNFFLPNDQATSFAWEINNDQTKPPRLDFQGRTVAFFDNNFEYDPNGNSGHKLWKFSTPGYRFDYYISDKSEAMAYACRSWGKAVGAYGATRGAIRGDLAVDLSDPVSFGGPKGFDAQHSAEFDRNIQVLGNFYTLLLDNLQLGSN